MYIHDVLLWHIFCPQLPDDNVRSELKTHILIMCWLVRPVARISGGDKIMCFYFTWMIHFRSFSNAVLSAEVMCHRYESDRKWSGGKDLEGFGSVLFKDTSGIRLKQLRKSTNSLSGMAW